MATKRTTSKQTDDNFMNETTKTILTLAAGAVAGAVTALLLAPQTGAETRRTLSRTAQNLKEDLNRTIQQGIDKINTMRKSAEDLVNEAAQATDETGRMQTANGTGNQNANAENTEMGNTGTL